MALGIGIKIQARNDNFINPTIPTRDEIRKSNYLRRRSQLNSEGFHSKIWKPYVSIGHPLKLDIALSFPLDAEGLHSKNYNQHILELDNGLSVSINNKEQSKENSKVLCGETLRVVGTTKQTQSKKAEHEPSQRKDRENFQELEKTLKEEIKKSEDVNFNVRVGQSFFGFIQKEKTEREKEAIKQKIKAEMDMIAPEDDTGSDSENDNPFSVQRESGRATRSSNQSRCRARPFTPLYNNISSIPSGASSRSKSVFSALSIASESTTFDIEESSLYRQLCSLHWLLSAMAHDDVANMPRISLSWTLPNEDNDLTSTKNKAEIKTVWDKYVNKWGVTTELSKDQEHKSKSRTLANIPTSYRSINTSDSSPPRYSIESDMQTSADIEEIEVSSLSRPQIKPSASATSAYNLYKTPQSKSTRTRNLRSQMRSVCDQLDKECNEYEERKSLHAMRIKKLDREICIAPKSTTLHPKDNFSDKLEHMVRRNRAKSAQVTDERMTELRENVKNMSEYKMTVCLNKFKDVQTHGAFHNMLKEFRYKNNYHSFFTAMDATKNKIVYAGWFLALEDSLKNYMENKRIEKVLKRIGKFALITAPKVKSHRLLSVLESLTDWEIRHPEINASIKFITDHIVLMDEEEYQRWFTNAFQ